VSDLQKRVDTLLAMPLAKTRPGHDSDEDRAHTQGFNMGYHAAVVYLLPFEEYVKWRESRPDLIEFLKPPA
jgi:hypothetical protein